MDTASGSRDIVRQVGTARTVERVDEQRELWRAEHLGVQGPHTTIAAWSTDARSGTPLLPALGPDEPAPTCLQTLRDGVVIYDALG